MKATIDVSERAISKPNPAAEDDRLNTLFLEAVTAFDDIAAVLTSSATSFLKPSRGFTPFNVGQVWYSPRRKLYRVIGHHQAKGQTTQAILQPISGAARRKVKRDVGATRKWCQVLNYVVKKEQGNPDKIHLAASSSYTALCDVPVSWKSFRIGSWRLSADGDHTFCPACAKKGEPTIALAALESQNRNAALVRHIGIESVGEAPKAQPGSSSSSRPRHSVLRSRD